MKPLSVSQFLDLINQTIRLVPEVEVEGEMSGLQERQGKWVFFDLKDEQRTVGCFLPKSRLKVPLEDGMRVVVKGMAKVTDWGKFSFNVWQLVLGGEGELRRAYELLKTKLDKEGLFAAERKRPLPAMPRTIGLITSQDSDARHDFQKILDARWGGVVVRLLSVAVQGLQASEQVAGALAYFNQAAQPPDVLVLVRGGGSLEDLAAFNTELVARAVAASRIPVVCGVGHEQDVTLADLAADQRAATPTDAANLVVPDRRLILERLNSQLARQSTAVGRRLVTLEQALAQAAADVSGYYEQLNARLDGLARQLELSGQRLRHQLDAILARLDQSRRRLGRAVTGQLELLTRQLASQSGLLEALGPSAVLNRGYALVRHQGKVLTRSRDVQRGDRLMIQLREGNLGAKVDG